MLTPDEAARLRLLHDLGTAFTARIELDELIPLVMSKCREVLDAEGTSVLLLDPVTQELYFPYVAEEDAEVMERLLRLRVPAGRGLAGEVLRTGRALRVDDVSADPRFYGGIDAETGLTTRSLLSAPLAARQGIVGLLQVVNRRGGGLFSDADLAFLEALAGAVAVAIENARLFAQVRASEAGLRAQVGAFKRDRARREGFADMVASGAAMAEVVGLMQSAAASPIAVLIEGETGTGKELVARGIHAASTRGENAFVAVNCAALPETLLESELFGHRRGAFTGATQDQRGLFEAASGGTIFLDEIGEMPAAMQAKLLRVLQEGEVVPLGDRRPRRVDVRVISATNRELMAEVHSGRFRQDLFYRVAAFPISVPPLRKRREDVPLLAARFVAAAAGRHQKHVAGFEPPALEALGRFDWPGNVRELENEVERAVALARDGEVIAVRHLSAKVAGAPPLPPTTGAGAPAEANGPAGPIPLRAARAAFEARHIARVLGLHAGNVTRAAAALGLSRFMLQKKMKEYGLRDER
jgi:Nif-specific regulatory protein